MFVISDLSIAINGKVRADSLAIDLSHSKTLNEFKRHLLAESKLSAGEHDKYMLSYLYANYLTLNGEDK
jgi:hypothetical protein